MELMENPAKAGFFLGGMKKPSGSWVPVLQLIVPANVVKLGT